MIIIGPLKLATNCLWEVSSFAWVSRVSTLGTIPEAFPETRLADFNAISTLELDVLGSSTMRTVFAKMSFRLGCEER